MLSKRYTIIVEGGLGQRFTAAFPSASLVAEEGKTRLDTEPLDQSQLHGLLERLRSFAIELVSVQEVVDLSDADDLALAPADHHEQADDHASHD